MNLSIFKEHAIFVLAIFVKIRPFDMYKMYSSKVCFYCTTNREPYTIKTNLG